MGLRKGGSYELGAEKELESTMGKSISDDDDGEEEEVPISA
jgi:hypothetical protein